MKLYGLMITRNDHAIFEEWCRDQLGIYDCVICLDGSDSNATKLIAEQFADRLVYLHEQDHFIPYKTDHGLRKVVHDEIIARFGYDCWIMCCHADEFCYHDPRMVASKAESFGNDLVTWYSPHFYPHPSDLADWSVRKLLPYNRRFRHYHWSYFGNGLPWKEDRLYFAHPNVQWDSTTHGSVRPHGIVSAAQFFPIFKHFKVINMNLSDYDVSPNAAHYRDHWQGLEHRTGLPFHISRFEDFFVNRLSKYAACSQFDGIFRHHWNMGEEYRLSGLK